MACLLLIIYSLPLYLVERHHFGFISAKTLVNLESNLYKHSHPQNEGKYLHSKTFLLSVFCVALVLKVGLIHLRQSGGLVDLPLPLPTSSWFPPSGERNGSTLPERSGLEWATEAELPYGSLRLGEMGSSRSQQEPWEKGGNRVSLFWRRALGATLLPELEPGSCPQFLLVHL